MVFKDALRIAVKSLRANVMRSALTALGIVIGVSSIVLISALGGGAQKLILSQIEGLGTKTLVVIPGREPTGPSDTAQIFSDSLKEKDLAALLRKEEAPTVRAVVPVVFGGDSSSYGRETYHLSIFGTSPEIEQIFDAPPEQGAYFSDEDVRAAASVIVIGSKVKQELFGAGDAIREIIRIKGRPFRVIGVLPAKGQVSFFNFDETAIMPHTSASRYIFGVKYFHRIIIEAESERDIERTVADVKAVLRQSHNLSEGVDDFFIQTQADLANRIKAITSALTAFLAAVAGISLFVAGIGIMNIMLVSVTERTREIGIRKAVGAGSKDILLQFLVEAVILTTGGGVIGVAIGAAAGIGISFILARALSLVWIFDFPIVPAIIGFLVSVAVGLVFGLYPARKAARKHPIEALRYE